MPLRCGSTLTIHPQISHPRPQGWSHQHSPWTDQQQNFKYISLLILTLSPLFTQQAASNSLPPAVELPQGYFQRKSRFLREWLISCNSGYCKVGIYSWAGLRLPLNSIKNKIKTPGLLKNTRAALLVLPEGLPATSSSLQQWYLGNNTETGDQWTLSQLPCSSQRISCTGPGFSGMAITPTAYFTVTAGKRSAPKYLAWCTRDICTRWGVQRVKKEPWNQTSVPHQWSWDTTQHSIPLAICFSFVSPLSYWCVQLEIPASINNPFVWPSMHSSSRTKRMDLLQIKMHRGWSVEQFKSRVAYINHVNIFHYLFLIQPVSTLWQFNE